MIKPTSVAEYLKNHISLPVIDVRSPAEFANGHVPGAFNVPLFSDEERAIVGTIYKKEGREQAVRKGFEFVSPHITSFIDKTRDYTQHKEIVLYCARGGMRSRSVAMLLDFSGYTIHLITGGFKAYKQYLRTRATEFNNFVLIGGKTGSGKTEILHELRNAGEQIIDLEGLACHKGSALGQLGQQPQPSQEQFIINCLSTIAPFSPEKIVWLEHEGSRLGAVQIPQELWNKMAIAPVIHIDLPTEYRKNRLMAEYGIFSPAELKPCIQKMEQRLGGAVTTALLKLLENNDTQVLDILLDHYDRAYLFSKKRNTHNHFFELQLEALSPAEHAQAIKKMGKKIACIDFCLQDITE